MVGSFTSTWVTALTSFPVAVPDKIFGLTLILDFIDRCHSLSSLHPPPAAVASLPVLDDGAAAHFCVKYGTKEFCVFLQILCVFAGKRQALAHLIRDPSVDMDELLKPVAFKFSLTFDKF